MKWFNVIKDFKYSHGKHADPDMQGLEGYQGVPKSAAGFSRGNIASVNLSANAWKDMLYDSGKYNPDNEKKVIETMSNTLTHEYAHVLFRKVSGYNGVESALGQPLSDIFLGLILGIQDKDVFDLDKEVTTLIAACKKDASIRILDELYAGYAGKNIEGISRLIIDRYKDFWIKDFKNTLQRIKSRVMRTVGNAIGDDNEIQQMIYNIRRPIAEQHLSDILEILEMAWSDAVDFIYGHFVAVQQKRYYLGTLPENEDTTVGEMTTLISRYLDKAGYEDIQRFINGGDLNDKVLEEIGFSRRNR